MRCTVVWRGGIKLKHGMFLSDRQKGKFSVGIIKAMQPVTWRYCVILIAVGFQDWADKSSEQLHLGSVDPALGRRLDKCRAGVPSTWMCLWCESRQVCAGSGSFPLIFCIVSTSWILCFLQWFAIKYTHENFQGPVWTFLGLVTTKYSGFGCLYR